MKLLNSKKGNMSIENKVNWIIYMIVGFMVVFKIAAAMIPEGQDAGDELNASGVPLGSFFVGDGIVWLLVMVSILLLTINSSLGRKK